MEPSQYNEIIIKHHCKSHYSNDEDIHKLLNYIAGNGKKKQKILHIGNYGLDNNPDTASSQIIAIQRLLKKNTKRRLYHITVSFPTTCKNTKTVIQLSDKIGKFIFQKYQVFYAVHGTTDNLHIHFAFNATSYITGKKCHLDKENTKSFKIKVHEIISKQIIS